MGATLATVAGGRILSAEHRDLDVIRWANEAIDVTGRTERSDILHRIRTVLDDICADSGSRPLAVRLRLSGQTPQHARLLIDESGFRKEVEALLATLPSEVWLEKLVVATSAPSTPSALDPTIAGRLEAEITEVGGTPALMSFLDERLKEIRNKMPAGAHVDELFEQVRAQAPDRAVDLALCLIDEPEANPCASMS
jgi:hypothetical protein